MACDFDITKENIYDYIIEDTPGADEAIKALSGICSQRADSQWIIAHGELPDNRQLNISSLGYFTIPKLYGLMEGDADISALDEIGALRVLGQDNLQADGSNVLIGYVDTGIDYLNDVFKDVPHYTLDKTLLGGSAVELFNQEGMEIFPSKSEMRKLVKGGGVSLNKEKLTAFDQSVTSDDLIDGKYMLVQRGKKNYYLITVK